MPTTVPYSLDWTANSGVWDSRNLKDKVRDLSHSKLKIPCLLHVDAHKRMTLRELIAVLDLVPELSGPISTPPVESEPISATPVESEPIGTSMGTSSDESVIPSTNHRRPAAVTRRFGQSDAPKASCR